MDLRHMRHFVAVAEELHFGRAARRLNMAQPPLSQSIRRLELDLGLDLFDRSRRGVELTAAGRVFLGEAQRTLRQADLARKMAQREAQKTPEVRVSFIGPALYRVLPDLLVHFRAASPEVSVRLYERPSPEQMTGLSTGDFDLGFVASGTPQIEGCETLLVERAAYVAAVPADWPLAERETISLAELAEQPFILPPALYAPQSSATMAMFKSIGVMPHVAQEATQTNTTISLVGAGLGCSLVMATAALTQSRNVRFVAVQDVAAYGRWELIMAWRPDHLSSHARAFAAFTDDYVRGHPQLLDPAAPLA